MFSCNASLKRILFKVVCDIYICRFKDENVLDHICIYSLHYRSFCYYSTACILSSGFSTDSAFLVEILYLPVYISLKICTLHAIAQESLFYHFNDITILPLWARLWRVDCIHSSRDLNLVWKFIFISYHIYFDCMESDLEVCLEFIKSRRATCWNPLASCSSWSLSKHCQCR